MSPGEEASADTSGNSTDHKDAVDVISDASVLEKSERHHVVGEADGRVDGSTGVRSSNVDHTA